MGIWPFRKQNKAAGQGGTIVMGASQAEQEYASPLRNPNQYLLPKQDAEVFRVMRQALPIMDTAIDLLCKMTGNPKVKWDSERVQEEWDLFTGNCRIAPLSRSLGTWLNGHQGRTLLYGTGCTAINLTDDGRDIRGLQYVSSKTLRLRPDPDDALDVIVAQQQQGKLEPVVLDRDFVVLNAHEPQDDSPYGQSLFAHCPFIAELPVEMFHAQKLLWKRQGAPSQIITIKVDVDKLDPSIDLESHSKLLLASIKKAWNDAMQGRMDTGNIRDFFGIGEYDVKTIGSDLKEIEFQIPYRAAMEQIVGVTHLPPWMLGLHWSTTERLSSEQTATLEQILADYEADYTPTVQFIVDWWARCRGYANVGRQIVWPAMAIRDRAEQARASLLEEQAAKQRIANGRQMWSDGIINQQQYAEMVTGDAEVVVNVPLDLPSSPVDSGGGIGGLGLAASQGSSTLRGAAGDGSGSSSVAKHSRQCGCSVHGVHKSDGDDEGNPLLDYGSGEQPSNGRTASAIFGFYSDIIDAARQLRSDVWNALGLPAVSRRVLAGATITKADDDPFSMTAEQERVFNSAVDKFLATMAGEDRSAMAFPEGDGLIQEWDRFAWQVGSDRVVEMTGAEATAILPARAYEAQRQLLANAFDKLSENGQMRLEGQLGELRDILQGGLAEGLNPLEVARQMSDRFDSYERYEFARLARTEMAFAQNAGQIEEANAEGVDMSGVDVNAFPAHPNCLCDYSIEEDSAGGWKMVYNVSAQACEVCQAYIA